MKPKTLLILTVVALLLGAFIYFVERDVPSTEEKEELETRVLGLDAEDVDAFTLHRPGAEPETIRFVRREPDADYADADDAESDDAESENDAAGWRLAEPMDAEADATEVGDVLRRLLELEKERELDDVNRENAGLDAPRLEVVLESEDGERRLRVGADVPLDGGVLVDSGGTVMQAELGDELLDDLLRGVDAWRERDLFPALRADVERITLSSNERTSDESEVVLARPEGEGGGDEFRIASPLEDRADADHVRVLLGALVGLEAETFVEDGADFEPRATVEVGLAGDDEPFRIELGPPVRENTEDTEATADTEDAEATEDATLHARVDGQRVTISAGSWLEMARRDADAWRSRAWTSAQVFEVDEATFAESGKETLTLRRDGSDWQRTIGDGEPQTIPYSAASDALYPATEIRAADLQRRGELSAETLAPPPRLEIRLVTKGDAEDDIEGEDDVEAEVDVEESGETLRLWGSLEAAGLEAATTEAREGVVLLLPATEVEELLAAVEAARNAEPVPEVEKEEGGAP